MGTGRYCGAKTPQLLSLLLLVLLLLQLQLLLWLLLLLPPAAPPSPLTAGWESGDSVCGPWKAQNKCQVGKESTEPAVAAV